MLIRISFFASTPVKAAQVNCEPGSVLKISGFPCLGSASCNAAMQNDASEADEVLRDPQQPLPSLGGPVV
jgi:hypothetical protein